MKVLEGIKVLKRKESSEVAESSGGQGKFWRVGKVVLKIMRHSQRATWKILGSSQKARRVLEVMESSGSQESSGKFSKARRVLGGHGSSGGHGKVLRAGEGSQEAREGWGTRTLTCLLVQCWHRAWHSVSAQHYMTIVELKGRLDTLLFTMRIEKPDKG